MKIQQHFVAYVDILGFANYVKENLPTPEKPLELLQQFIEKAKMFNKTNDLSITAFSDNIVISMLSEGSFPAEDTVLKYYNFINYINSVQLHMLTGIGILPIRGGVTLGDLHHNEGEILFGEALGDAYNLERSQALYPRIVVNPHFLDPYKYLAIWEHESREGRAEKHTAIKAKQSERQYPVAYDFDGVLYCNYLSSLYLPERQEWAENSHSVLNQHKLFVERWLQGVTDMNILRKYTWMKSYHNWFCEPFKQFHKYTIHNLRVTAAYETLHKNRQRRSPQQKHTSDQTSG